MRVANPIRELEPVGARLLVMLITQRKSAGGILMPATDKSGAAPARVLKRGDGATMLPSGEMVQAKPPEGIVEGALVFIDAAYASAIVGDLEKTSYGTDTNEKTGEQGHVKIVGWEAVEAIWNPEEES